MADVASTAAGAAGLTVLGVATGLAPELLLAGFIGGVWAQTYAPPTPYLQRVTVTVLAAALSGYFAPVAAAIIAVTPIRGATVAASLLTLPVSLVIGFLAQRVLGPALLRMARKKSEDALK